MFSKNFQGVENMNMKCGIKHISDTLIADKKKLSFLKQGAIKKQWLPRESVICLPNAPFDLIHEKNRKASKSIYEKHSTDIYEEHRNQAIKKFPRARELWLGLFLFCIFGGPFFLGFFVCVVVLLLLTISSKSENQCNWNLCIL